MKKMEANLLHNSGQARARYKSSSYRVFNGDIIDSYEYDDLYSPYWWT